MDRGFGYNLTNGGERTFKVLEARAKMLVAAIKNFRSPEFREKLVPADRQRPTLLGTKEKVFSKSTGEKCER